MEEILVPIFELNDGSSKKTIADVKEELWESGELQKILEECDREWHRLLEDWEKKRNEILIIKTN